MSKKFIKPEMEQHILNSIKQNVRRMKALVEQKNKILASTDGSRVLYDKDNSRTEIYITEAESG